MVCPNPDVLSGGAPRRFQVGSRPDEALSGISEALRRPKQYQFSDTRKATHRPPALKFGGHLGEGGHIQTQGIERAR